MSNYNSQLQSNNDILSSNIVDLQRAIDKANSLPDAGSGSNENEDAFVMGTLSNYTNNRVSFIGSSAFYASSSLQSVNFPAVVNIGAEAFGDCITLQYANFPLAMEIGRGAFRFTALKSANFPSVVKINWEAFYNCVSLDSVDFPATTSIGMNAFYKCYGLQIASFPSASYIGVAAFEECQNLRYFYLIGSSVCTLQHSTAFHSTPIAGDSTNNYGSIYVPASLLQSYKTATNWVYFSSRFTAYETGDGEAGAITFTINGVKYQAEQDMTWAEWCESEHNTLGLYADEYGVMQGEDPEMKYVYYADYSEITGLDVIINNMGYILNY